MNVRGWIWTRVFRCWSPHPFCLPVPHLGNDANSLSRGFLWARYGLPSLLNQAGPPHPPSASWSASCTAPGGEGCRLGECIQVGGMLVSLLLLTCAMFSNQLYPYLRIWFVFLPFDQPDHRVLILVSPRLEWGTEMPLIGPANPESDHQSWQGLEQVEAQRLHFILNTTGWTSRFSLPVASPVLITRKTWKTENQWLFLDSSENWHYKANCPSKIRRDGVCRWSQQDPLDPLLKEKKNDSWHLLKKK